MNAPSQQGPSADFAQHSTAGVSPSSRRFQRLQELRQSLQDQISVQRSRRHDKAFVSPKITGDRTFTSRDLLYDGAGAPNPNQWRRRPSHAPAQGPMHADGAPLMSRSAAPPTVADRGDVWRDGGMRQQHVPIQHAPESAGPLINSSSQHNANSDREWRGATSEPSLGHSANVGFSDRDAGEDIEGWISHSPETFTVGRRGLQQQSHKQALEQQMADNAARRRAEKEEDVMSSMVGSHPSASPNANDNPPPPHRTFAASIANIGQYEASQAMHDGRRGRGYRSSEAGHTNNHTMAASSTSAAHHHHGGLVGGSHGGLGSDNYRSPLSIKRELALRAGEALRAQMALHNGGGGYGFSSVGGAPTTTNSPQAADERQARALQLQRIRSELEEQIREQRERKAREREADAMEEAKFAALALASSEQRSAAVVPRAAMGGVPAVSNFGQTTEIHQPLAATASHTFAAASAAPHSAGFGGGGALPPVVVANGQGFGHHFQQQHAEQPTVNAPRSKDDRTLATATAFEAMRLQVAEEKRLRFLEKKRMLQQSSAAAAALVSSTAPQPGPLHVSPSGGVAVGGEGHSSPTWHGAPHSPHTSSQAAAFSAPPAGVAAPFTATQRREEGFSATATNSTEASGAATTAGLSAVGFGGRSPHHLPAIGAEGRPYETTTNIETTTVSLDQRRMIAEPAPTAFTEEDPSQAFHTVTEERRRNRSVFGRTAESGIVRHATGGCDGEEMGIQCRFEGTDGGVAGSARKNTPQTHSSPSPRPNVHHTYSTYNETETTQQHISTTKMSGPPTPGRGDGADTLQQDGQHQLRTETETTVYAAAASTAPPPSPPPPRRLLLPPIASASVEAHARGGVSEVPLQEDQKTAGGVHNDSVVVVSRRHLVLPPIASSPAAVGRAERKAVASAFVGSGSGRGFGSASASASRLLPSHSAFVSTRVRSTTCHHTPDSADDVGISNTNGNTNSDGAATTESIAADAHNHLEETSPCTFVGEEDTDARAAYASASSPSPAPTQAEADVITTSEVVSSAEVIVRRSPLPSALEGAGEGAFAEQLLIVGDATGRGSSLPSPANASSGGFARSDGLPTSVGGFFTVGDEDDAAPEGPFLGMTASPVTPSHATRARGGGGGGVHVAVAVNAEGPAETDTTLQPQQARPNVSSDGRSSAIYGGGGARWGPNEEGVGSDGDDGGYMDAETLAIMHQRGIPMPIEMLAGAVAAPPSGTAGGASSGGGGGGGGEEAIMAHLPSHHRYGGPSHAISPPPHIPPFPLYAPPQIIHIVQM